MAVSCLGRNGLRCKGRKKKSIGQKEGEPVDSSITDLFALVGFCNYRNLRDELIRNRLVVGTLDKQLSEKLQCDVHLMLEKAIIQDRQK